MAPDGSPPLQRMFMRFRLSRWLVTGSVILAACGGDKGSTPAVGVTPGGTDGTFTRIQRQIFDPSCASCHSSGSSQARQSQLVLSADSSYQQLVGTASVNQVAKADGLPRVRAFRADSSLLFHKLAWVPGHHSRDYGQFMPTGTTQGSVKVECPLP